MFRKAEVSEDESNSSFLSKFMSFDFAASLADECVPAKNKFDQHQTKNLPAHRYYAKNNDNISPFSLKDNDTHDDDNNTSAVRRSFDGMMGEVPPPPTFLKYTASEGYPHKNIRSKAAALDFDNDALPGSVKNPCSTYNRITTMVAEATCSLSKEVSVDTKEKNNDSASFESEFGNHSSSSTYMTTDSPTNASSQPEKQVISDDFFRELQNELKSARAVTGASIQEITTMFLKKQKKKHEQELKNYQQQHESRLEKKEVAELKEESNMRHSTSPTLVLMTGIAGIKDVLGTFTSEIQQELKKEEEQYGRTKDILITSGNVTSSESETDVVSFRNLSSYWEESVHEKDYDNEEEEEEIKSDNGDNDKADRFPEEAQNRKSNRKSRISLSSISSETDSVAILTYNPGEVDGNPRISILTLSSALAEAREDLARLSFNESFSSLPTLNEDEADEDGKTAGRDFFESETAGSLPTATESDQGVEDTAAALDTTTRSTNMENSARSIKKRSRKSSHQNRSSIHFDKLNRSSLVLLTNDSAATTKSSTTRVSALAFECEIDFDEVLQTNRKNDHKDE